MQNAALAQLGLDDWHYQALPLPPHLFTETVKALPRLNFKGVNVTIPHKEQALALADEATETARAIGAANTLTFNADGTIHADNTDAPRGWPTNSAPRSATRPPRSSSTRPPSACATPRRRSRRSPCTPMNWVPDARWWTWSTGTAAHFC
jgi:hypothetical protein